MAATPGRGLFGVLAKLLVLKEFDDGEAAYVRIRDAAIDELARLLGVPVAMNC